MNKNDYLEIIVILSCIFMGIFFYNINGITGNTILAVNNINNNYHNCGDNKSCILDSLKDCSPSIYSNNEGSNNTIQVWKLNSTHCNFNISIPVFENEDYVNRSAFCQIHKENYSNEDLDAYFENRLMDECVGSLPGFLRRLKGIRPLELNFNELEDKMYNFGDTIVLNVSLILNTTYPEVNNYNFKYSYDNLSWQNAKVDVSSMAEGDKQFYLIGDFDTNDLDKSQGIDNKLYMQLNLDLEGTFNTKEVSIVKIINLNYSYVDTIKPDDYEPDNEIGNLSENNEIGIDRQAQFRNFNVLDDNDFMQFDVKKDGQYIITIKAFSENMYFKVKIFDESNNELFQSNKVVSKYIAKKSKRVYLDVINEGDNGYYKIDIKGFEPEEQEENNSGKQDPQINDSNINNTDENTTASNESTRLNISRCTDGIDNDGDGFVDFDGFFGRYHGDPGCENETDNSEYNYVPGPVQNDSQLNLTGQNNTDNDSLNNNQCVPDWVCEEWSDCLPNSLKKRECIDENECNILDGIPDEIIPCDYNSTMEDNIDGDTETSNQNLCYNGILDDNEEMIDCGGNCQPCLESSANSNDMTIENPNEIDSNNNIITIIIILIITIFIIGGGTTAFMIFNANKPKPIKPNIPIQSNVKKPNFTNSQLSNYVKQTLQQGYNANELRNYLTSTGWPQQEIDKCIKNYYANLKLQQYLNRNK